MTQEKYNRAVQISNRLSELEKVKEEISDKKINRLRYAYRSYNGNWSLTPEWRMRYIYELLDKHDEMIRAEIDEEIEKLKKEIELI